MRTLSESAVKLIKTFEGLSLKPYLCPANVPTIGYGTTVYPDGRKVSVKDPPITEAQADEFLRHDAEKFCSDVERLVTVSINDNQFGALVSFCYNLGAAALQNSSLLKKLNSGRHAEAAEEFLKWVYAAGQVLPGLVKRRQAERALFLHPVN